MSRAAEIAHYRECDERIAAAWDKYWEVQRVVAEHLRSAASHRRSAKWYAEGTKNFIYYTEQAAVSAAKAEALQPEADALRKAAVDLDAELYTGWPRFFLVKHIHSSQHCSSFRPTTRIGWLPKVSGLTEVEAVGEYGESLCTICYPSAPVELTTKALDPSLCTGSGKYHSTEHLTGRENAYSYASGYCPDCLRWNTLTKSGNMRKHKVDVNKRHATESMKGSV
jgi:hypothetical protein